MILVTGATGNAGGAVVRALVDAGQAVRALVRDAESSPLPQGVEVALGDLNRPETLKRHLEGVTGVFLLSGYEGLDETLANMREAGVERIVLLSGGAAVATDPSNPISQYMIRSEEAVRGAKMAWTILRPYEFMSNALRWAEQLRDGDVIRAPFANVGVAVIDPRDIAAVAVTALLEEGHEGKAYRLSGPRTLLPEDRVRILGRALGRELRFEAQPDDEARAEMSASMPPEYVDAFMHFYVDGWVAESQVLPTVEEVTGREPRTFEQWAVEHAGSFHPPVDG
jgi:uncharacterized protein YbjT (DUF2867 family)